MTARKSVNSLSKIVLLTAFCLALSPIAAISQVCMDMSGDGEVNGYDLRYFLDYLFLGGPPPADISTADLDGFENVTTSDWTRFEGFFSAGYPTPDCSVLYPPIIPVVDSTFYLSHTQWVDSGVTSTIISLELYKPIELQDVSIVFMLDVGNVSPQVDSIRSYRGRYDFKEYDYGFVNNDVIVAAIPTIHFVTLERIFLTFDLYVTVNSSLLRRPVKIEFAKTSPLQAANPDSSFITMLVEQVSNIPLELKVWEPVITCCYQDRGDLNGDGEVNILDLTDIVCFLFRGCGNTANCPEETDINGDGTLNNILDLTALVDYIFRGGSLTSCYE